MELGGPSSAPGSCRSACPGTLRARRATPASRATGAAPAPRHARTRPHTGRSDEAGLRPPAGRRERRGAAHRGGAVGGIDELCGRLEDREVDVISASGLEAMPVGDECRPRRLDRGRLVGHPRRRVHGVAPGQAGPAEHAAHGHVDRVVALQVAVVAGLGEVGDRRDDELGVARERDVRAEPEPASGRPASARSRCPPTRAASAGARAGRRPRSRVTARFSALRTRRRGWWRRGTAPGGASLAAGRLDANHVNARPARNRPHVSPFSSAMSATRTAARSACGAHDVLPERVAVRS